MNSGSISALIAAVPLPLILIGPDQRVTVINPLAEALFGKSAPGRPYVTLLRQPAVLDCIEAAFASQSLQTARYATCDAARDVTYLVTASPIQGSVMLTFEDISGAQATDAMRRDFVANVSHELRTPLTAMLGFIETLRGPARGDAQARERFLGIMQSEATRMNRLINDLLSLARVEDTERQRPSDRVDLSQVVARALVTLQWVTGAAGPEVKIKGTDRPMPALGDADQLLQVVTNLIENALKYGGTTVSITLGDIDHDPDVQGPGICIEGADDGPGIDPVHIPRLTERFYRVDGHRARDLGGTGLGLATVKHIVNRHRGRLKIDGAPGQGSRFTVTLPKGAQTLSSGALS